MSAKRTPPRRTRHDGSPFLVPRPPPLWPVLRRYAPRLAFGVLGLLLAASAGALSSDRYQPVSIEADHAEAGEHDRVSIYLGNAVIVQGTLHITGDIIRIYLNADDEFVKLVSLGSPASMRQLPDDSDQHQSAKADRLEYFANHDLIVLLGRATYGQGADRMSAARIVYDSHHGRLKAHSRPVTPGQTTGAGEEQEPSRVRITIKPRKSADP